MGGCPSTDTTERPASEGCPTSLAIDPYRRRWSCCRCRCSLTVRSVRFWGESGLLVGGECKWFCASRRKPAVYTCAKPYIKKPNNLCISSAEIKFGSARVFFIPYCEKHGHTETSCDDLQISSNRSIGARPGRTTKKQVKYTVVRFKEWDKEGPSQETHGETPPHRGGRTISKSGRGPWMPFPDSFSS